MSEYQFYALTTVILFFKMIAISVVQGVGRVNTKTFVTAEDARFFAQAPPALEEAPIVKRAAMAWRNDLENIPMFLFLGLIYVTVGCWPEGAYIYFTIFVIARILHTIAYLNGMQPWRTIFFTVGMFVCVTLSIQILGAVL
ncbi:MAPEG family protein [Candidatus Binatus sp.]|uniref:MAPEG family protein n=1 Tax=Candidatus Binatus sp. TaxID=2811406 RepID=UPI003C5CFC2B